MKKVSKEWSVDAPWGKIAVLSWGNPALLPVLMVHGRQDSAATFIPLLEYLPDDYYYVGIDLPGHGKSDPFPTGVQITRHHFIMAVDFTVRQLAWDQFIYMSHSMGCDQGLFYNAIYPHKITKFIFFDPAPSLQRLQEHHYPTYYKKFYEAYYDNYELYVKDDRVYSKRKALDAVKRARGLNEGQAELVLERNLIAVGDDQYKLAWDRRLKFPAPPNYPPDFYFKLFTENLPPTLIVTASVNTGELKAKPVVDKLISDMRVVRNIVEKVIEGSHDVHLIKPQEVAKHVVEFLNKEFSAKL